MNRVSFFVLCVGLSIFATGCESDTTTIGGILFIALGLLTLGFVIVTWKYAKVKDWPTTTGKILNKKVVLSKSRSSTDPSATYIAYAKYEYTIDDTTYVSDSTSPGTPLYDMSTAKRAVEGIPDNPAVFYNPEKASEAYLFPDPKGARGLVIFLGLFFVFLGIGVFFV